MYEKENEPINAPSKKNGSSRTANRRVFQWRGGAGGGVDRDAAGVDRRSVAAGLRQRGRLSADANHAAHSLFTTSPVDQQVARTPSRKAEVARNPAGVLKSPGVPAADRGVHRVLQSRAISPRSGNVATAGAYRQRQDQILNRREEQERVTFDERFWHIAAARERQN
jgi:hypothetical protein